MIVDNFCLLQQYEIKQSQNTIAAIDHKHARLQNSPYFCVFKYVRAVKQKVWKEAENSKTLTPRFTDFFTDFVKKPTVLQFTFSAKSQGFSFKGAFTDKHLHKNSEKQ